MKKGSVLKATAATIALTVCISGARNFVDYSKIPYTEADIINNQTYIEEYQNLEKTTQIEFTNPELLEAINESLGYELTATNIRDITKLKITKPLTNQDFSDLKYFLNLKELNIYFNDIDLKDLEYNQSLEQLVVSYGDVTNTNLLPNSIKTLMLMHSIVKDHLLYLPFNTEMIFANQAAFTNVKVKNPDRLMSFIINSNLCTIDLSFLEECKNLLSVEIKYCPNITNPEVLTKLNKKCFVTLDDYAPIWLTEDIFRGILNISDIDRENIRSETKTLDKLAATLVPDQSISDTEKIKIISNYIALQLTYSEEIAETQDAKSETAIELNDYPIMYALNDYDKRDEVCINYACLFQALANRVGLNSKQVMSDNHTWNVVDDKNIDTTALDSTIFMIGDDETIYSIEDLIKMEYNIPDYVYFVKDVNDEPYKEIYHSEEVLNVDNNIGYVSKEDKSFIERLIFYFENGLISLLALYSYIIVKKIIEDRKYQKEENEEKEYSL